MGLPGTNDQGLLRPVSINFNPETGYLVLSLDKISYGYQDQPVRYQGRIFAPKEELHITVISSQAAEMMLNFLAKEPEELHAVEDLIHSTDWRFRKLEELHHLEEAPGVETIIEMVELPQLDAFFRGLSGVLRQGILLPPPHVTLYMRGTETGIGLPSQADFNELARASVAPDELQPVENTPDRPGADQGLA